MSKKPVKYKAPSQSVLLKLKERFESTVHLNNDGKNYTAEDIDHLLNYWFSGRSHKAIAEDLGRPISTIQNKVNKLLRGYSKADKAYRPTKERLSRVGAPWTLLDGRAVAITFRYMGRGPASTEHVARVLGRSTEEIDKYMNKKKGFLRDESEPPSKKKEPSPLALPDPVSLQATILEYGEETNSKLAALNKKITNCEALLTKLLSRVEGYNTLSNAIYQELTRHEDEEEEERIHNFVIGRLRRHRGKTIREYFDGDDWTNKVNTARVDAGFDSRKAAIRYAVNNRGVLDSEGDYLINVIEFDEHGAVEREDIIEWLDAD